MSDSPLPSPDAFDEPFFFFSNDKDAKILYVSPSVEKILGYKPEDLIGKQYLEFVNIDQPLNADVHDYRNRRFEAKDVSHELQVRKVQASDGTQKILQVQTYGAMDSEGNIINHAIAEDVTECFLAKIELKEKWKTLRALDQLLSAREREVLDFVLEGRLNKSIARELEITERAVERIRARLKKKFGTDSSAELVSKATELRLLDSLGFKD